MSISALPLLDKVAIVTGGGSGIGRCIALEFARAGANVVIVSRTLSKVEKVADEVKACGRRTLALVTDIRLKNQVQDMAKKTVSEFGRIDILVNNAAILRNALLPDMTEEMWDEVMESNLKSVFLCTQAVSQYMVEKQYGRIINISSVVGRGRAAPGVSCYSASKTGVIALTKCYAFELGPYNITVNAISPGWVLTDMHASTGRTPEQLEKIEEKIKSATVLGKLGRPEDIAKAAVFLASDDAAFITGQNLPVDGGRADLM